jgi:hypothetical protein
MATGTAIWQHDIYTAFPGFPMRTRSKGRQPNVRR